MVSIILGSNEKAQMVEFLNLIGFFSENNRSYTNGINQGFEFYFTEAEAKFSLSTEIFISVNSNIKSEEFFLKLEKTELHFEIWEHPKFYDLRVTDPAGKIWQIMLNY